MKTKENATIVRETETYFHLTNAFLEVQAATLNDTLKECGMRDAKKRQEICEVFGLAMGEIYDYHWLCSKGKKYYPLLMFSEKFLTSENKLSDIGKIQGSPKTDEFHPLGVDAATVYFEDKNQKLGLKEYGIVGQEDQAPDPPLTPPPKKKANRKRTTKKK